MEAATTACPGKFHLPLTRQGAAGPVDHYQENQRAPAQPKHAEPDASEAVVASCGAVFHFLRQSGDINQAAQICRGMGYHLSELSEDDGLDPSKLENADDTLVDVLDLMDKRKMATDKIREPIMRSFYDVVEAESNQSTCDIDEESEIDDGERPGLVDSSDSECDEKAWKNQELEDDDGEDEIEQEYNKTVHQVHGTVHELSKSAGEDPRHELTLPGHVLLRGFDIEVLNDIVGKKIKEMGMDSDRNRAAVVSDIREAR